MIDSDIRRLMWARIEDFHMKTAQQLKEENAIQDRIAQGISEIRIAGIESFINSYKTQNITASEFLKLTDNLLQDELKQALGR